MKKRIGEIKKTGAFFLGTWRGGVFLVGLSVLALVTLAAKPSSTQENVTATIFDTDGNGGQTLFRSDDYNGTGQATYANPQVSNQITSTGEWRMQLGRSGRTVWVTPNEAINTLQPVGPPAGYYPSNEVSTHCWDQSGNAVPLENVVNGSNNCSFAVNFITGGIEYRLLMNPTGVPGQLPSSCPSAGCPATGLATVTCNAVSSGNCVSWTITPYATGPNPTVANLFSYTGSRTVPWVYVGQYQNTFRITVTYP